MSDMNRLVAELADQRIATADAASRGFNRAMASVSRNWRRSIQEFVAGEGNIAAGRLGILTSHVQAARNLRAGLNESGYEQTYRSFVKAYDAQDAINQQILEALDVPSVIAAGPKSLDTLKALRDMDLEMFDLIGNDAVTAVSREITLNVIAGKSRGQIIDALTGPLNQDLLTDGRQANPLNLTARASLYADTSVRIYDRQSALSHYEDAVDHWLYYGPQDVRNRPFCATHVERIYTTAQVNRMRNGNGQSPAQFPTFGQDAKVWCGGWRCRHVFVPSV